MNARESLRLFNALVNDPAKIASLDADTRIQMYVFMQNANTRDIFKTPDQKKQLEALATVLVHHVHNDLSQYNGSQTTYLRYLSLCCRSTPLDVLQKGLDYQHQLNPIDTSLFCAYVDYTGIQTTIFRLLAYALEHNIVEPTLKCRSLFYAYLNREIDYARFDYQMLSITPQHLDILLKNPIDPKEYKNSFMSMMSSARNRDEQDANPDLAYLNMKLYAASTNKTIPVVFCEWLHELKRYTSRAEERVFQSLLSSPELYAWSPYLVKHFEKHGVQLQVPTKGALKWFNNTLDNAWMDPKYAIENAHPDLQHMVDPIEHHFSPMSLELWKACVNQKTEEPIHAFDFSFGT